MGLASKLWLRLEAHGCPYSTSYAMRPQNGSCKPPGRARHVFPDDSASRDGVGLGMLADRRGSEVGGRVRDRKGNFFSLAGLDCGRRMHFSLPPSYFTATQAVTDYEDDDAPFFSVFLRVLN